MIVRTQNPSIRLLLPEGPRRLYHIKFEATVRSKDLVFADLLELNAAYCGTLETEDVRLTPQG